MTAPTAYTVSYSFAGFQALNPATPLPAGSVDTEFANIETSVDSIIAALADIRRADGKLENGVVSWDALDADVQARFDGADRITISDINPGAFASQTEAESGVANDKIVTPLRAKQAVDALRAFASQAQAQAGTDNLTVMSPLRTAEAITAQRPLASQAEAEAGTNTTTVLTPQRGAQMLAALRTALTATQNLTWTAIAAGASSEQTITVTGALANDRVLLGLPNGLAAGLIPTAWISATNTVRIRLTNVTAGSLTPHSGAATPYAVTVVRF